MDCWADHTECLCSWKWDGHKFLVGPVLWWFFLSPCRSSRCASNTRFDIFSFSGWGAKVDGDESVHRKQHHQPHASDHFSSEHLAKSPSIIDFSISFPISRNSMSSAFLEKTVFAFRLGIVFQRALCHLWIKGFFPAQQTMSAQFPPIRAEVFKNLRKQRCLAYSESLLPYCFCHIIRLCSFIGFINVGGICVRIGMMILFPPITQ